MTLYQKNVTIPANTPKASPYEAEIEFDEDVLAEIQLYFPPPSGHLCHAACWYGEEQFLPSADYDWVSGNDETVKAEPMIEADETWTTIRLEAYNEDDTYDHTLLWRVRAFGGWRVFWKKAMYRLTSRLESFMRWMGG